MRMILTLLFIVFPSFSQSLEPKLETATRTLQRSDGFFVIEYRYGGFATVPLTNPPGQPHYSATITVSMVVDGKRHQLGQPFAGEYTLNGCFEDAPESLVDYALKHKDDPPPLVKGGRGKNQSNPASAVRQSDSTVAGGGAGPRRRGQHHKIGFLCARKRVPKGY